MPTTEHDRLLAAIPPGSDPIGAMAASIDSPAERRRLEQEQETRRIKAERAADAKAWTDEVLGQYARHHAQLQQSQDGKGRPHCSQCSYFTFSVDDTKAHGKFVGRCHGVPPAAVFNSSEHGIGSVNGFPLVYTVDWCPLWTDEPISVKVSS